MGLALRAVILPLDDARRLAAASAQIIELGAPHLAAPHHLDRVDHRRIKRKDTLDAFAVGNLADGEILVEPGPGAADAYSFVGLHAGALAFDDLDVDHHGVARLKFGDFLAGGELRHLFVFDFLDQVHGEVSKSCATAALRARFRPGLSGLAQLLRYRAGFVTFPSFVVLPG